MGFIDAHVHVWTDDTAHYPLMQLLDRPVQQV
jgi:predicted TIM-barrel fold metal-dependent hydrolase